MLQYSEFTQINHMDKKLNVIGLSVIIPTYNQFEIILPFLAKLTPVLARLQQNCEVIFIDDGSTDNTWDLLSHLPLAECEYLSVKFSRHFGRDAAISAGLKKARGLAVVIFDADLQGPPELIPNMLRVWGEGYEVVQLRRRTRTLFSPLKRVLTGLFNKLSRCFTGGSEARNRGDIQLISRQVVDSINGFPERSRDMEYLFNWLGFSQVRLEFEDKPGGGCQVFPIEPKNVNSRVEDTASLAFKPLRVLIWIGGAISLFACLYGVFVFINILLFGGETVVYPAVLIAQMLLVGIQLLAFGGIGEYMARVLIEVKQRPLYLIEQVEQKMSLAYKRRHIV